ncbi:hypothetical protein LTR49_028855 [Elasticomyces elasticus]|nr:hypothetical protein LTR49_028855 [Elasticomyces elasticus]
MSTPPGLSLECSLPTGQVLSPSELDAWELKAARRGLLNLKTLLEGERMLELLADQIAEGDAYFKGLLTESKGQFKESRIDFKAKGMKSAQFLAWFEKIGGRQTTEGRREFFLETMAPAHPEHYSLGPYPMGVIETIGQHICRVRVDARVEVPDFVRAYGDDSYPTKMPVTGFLDDGTLFFYGLQELRDSEDGCDYRFRIIFPAAAPQVLFDEHTEHLAIEFGHWITTAAQAHHN